MNARRHPCQLLLPTLLALSWLGIGPAAGQGSGSFDDEVLLRVNQFRHSYGLAPLARNSDLDVSAQAHSEDMARRNVMSHYGANGSNPGQRIHAAGYPWVTWGENVAYGWATPAIVMNAWINSPGHRANLLNANFREIGIGVASSPATGRLYWTQDFGTRAGGVRSTASNTGPAPRDTDTAPAPGGTDGTVTPHVDTISPNSGPAGTLVVITGRGFGNGDGACLVLFGVTGSSLVESWTDTKIVVRLYGAVFGQGTVRVCNNSGRTSNGAIFRTTP
jgi:Cysteine-rich secretory protein family/IPT/TIG domain